MKKNNKINDKINENKMNDNNFNNKINNNMIDKIVNNLIDNVCNNDELKTDVNIDNDINVIDFNINGNINDNNYELNLNINDNDDDDLNEVAKKNNKKRNNHHNNNNRKQQSRNNIVTNNNCNQDKNLKKQESTFSVKINDKEKINEKLNKQQEKLQQQQQEPEPVNNNNNIDEQELKKLKSDTDDNININNNNQNDNNNKSETKMNGIIKSYVSLNHMNGNSNNNQNGIYNNNNSNESNICKICSKHVYHMEQIKAVKSIFHKSCFRCIECNKQLSMDSYSSHERQIYCKLHFKQLFQPKPNFNNTTATNGNNNYKNGNDMIIIENNNHNNTMDDDKMFDFYDNYNKSDDLIKDKHNTINDEYNNVNEKSKTSTIINKKYELIICENEPIELPSDVVRHNSKQQDVFENLALDLSNIRNRFETGTISQNNCKKNINNNNNNNQITTITRSESIHKIMQKYQSRVAGDPQCSSSDDEIDNVNINNDDSNNQVKEKIISFQDMSSLKSQWESGEIINKNQKLNVNNNNNIENDANEDELRRLKQKNSSEPLIQQFERAIAQSNENLSINNRSTNDLPTSINAGIIKEKFEKRTDNTESDEDRIERLRKEREAELNQISSNELKEARNKFKQIELGQQSQQQSQSNHDNSGNGHIESIDSKELQQRFNYFENLIDNGDNNHDEENHHQNSSTVKIIDDIPKVDITKKMLNKFKALEAANGEINGNGNEMKPLPKRITPTRETTNVYENEPLVECDPNIVKSSYKNDEIIQVEPEKAKHLRKKFENWQTEISERENNYRRDDDDMHDFLQFKEQRDTTTKNLRAMFESIQNETNKPIDKPQPRVNRFVQEKTYQQTIDQCYVCSTKIYPMEKMEFSGIKLHKNCFRCVKCHMPMRLDNFTQHAEKLYCIPHFKQLFMEKGNYDEGFGLEQHKDKWKCNNQNNNKTSATITAINSHQDVDNDDDIDNDHLDDSKTDDLIDDEQQLNHQNDYQDDHQQESIENY